MEVWYSDGVHGNERHLRLSEQRGRKRLTDWDIFRIDVDRFRQTHLLGVPVVTRGHLEAELTTGPDALSKFSLLQVLSKWNIQRSTKRLGLFC